VTALDDADAGTAGEIPPVAVGDELIPGYVVVELLRRGRRLDTYDVLSVERRCPCIVKIVRPDRAHEQRPAHALTQEGELLRRLTHPHLVRCYEVIETPYPAIVLETLPGDMLSAVIEDGRLAATDVAELGLQLTSVLAYLHDNGWLHLDVKPSNIVVAAGRATLIDLSLAAPPGSGRAGAGTRGYLAPEQAAGGPLLPATDVFGLGVTLGECLTGTLAYGNEATWDGPRWIRRARIAPRRRFVRQIARRAPLLAPLVGSCLATDPSQRPSIADVRAALRHPRQDDSA